MTAEKFEQENKKSAEQDTNQDGVVTVKEQKATIENELKNVWASHIARFFHDDIKYDNSNEKVAKRITEQVAQRVKRALDYIQHAKDNNIDIFIDNEGTGVDDTDGKLQKYTDASGKVSRTAADNEVKKSVANPDGTITETTDNGDTHTWDKNCLLISNTYTDKGHLIKQEYKYNEDGSYSITKSSDNGRIWHNIQMNNENNQIKNTGFLETKNGNFKAYAREGENVWETLARLGIKGADAQAVLRANPVAAANKKFKTNCADVYIPKAVIENMKKNNTFDEDRLAGAPKKPEIGL